jgi:hypothetical protein
VCSSDLDIASLVAVAAEIEALLVPLNRGAAKRVLGRIVREHGRTHDRTNALATNPDPPTPAAT